MTKLKALLAVVVALSLVSSKAPASADPVKNIVLVHGAWVDASGWKPVYEILTKQGFHITMVQVLLKAARLSRARPLVTQSGHSPIYL